MTQTRLPPLVVTFQRGQRYGCRLVVLLSGCCGGRRLFVETELLREAPGLLPGVLPGVDVRREDQLHDQGAGLALPRHGALADLPGRDLVGVPPDEEGALGVEQLGIGAGHDVTSLSRGMFPFRPTIYLAAVITLYQFLNYETSIFVNWFNLLYNQ